MFVRSPESIRPYQYVLEPLILYLNILAYQKKNAKYAGSYNIGPDKKDCIKTKVLVKKFLDAYYTLNKAAVDASSSVVVSTANPIKMIYNKKKKNGTKHEATFLRLDNKLVNKVFGYKEIFDMEETMKHTAAVYSFMLNDTNKKEFATKFIEYMHIIIDNLWEPLKSEH